MGGAAAGLGLLAACSPGPPPLAPGPARVHRVGLLRGNLDSSTFWDRLGELGHVEGRNLAREERKITDEDRAAGQASPPRYDEMAAELARIPVDVIVVNVPVALNAAVRATTSIPIVLMGSDVDPVALGLAQSMARPGGNVTGVIRTGRDLELKRLQLLAEAAPTMTKVLVFDGTPPISDDEWQAAAGSLGLGYLGVRLQSSDDLEAVFARAVAEGADGLLVQNIPRAAAEGDIIHALAERHRLPDAWARGARGLVQYDARQSEMQRSAAEYVDRILLGARPGELPIQLPTRFDLVVNLRAARAIGLTVPPTFLDHADQVIE